MNSMRSNFMVNYMVITMLKNFIDCQVASEACENEPSFEGELLQAAIARIHLKVAFRKLRKRGFI